MFLQDNVPTYEHASIANLARQYYLGNQSFQVGDSTFKKLVHLTGDRGFIFDAQRAAVLQAKAKKSPVQVYYYNYRAAQSLRNLLFNTTKDYGVCHADDSLIVLDNKMVDPTTTSEDLFMLQVLVKMWYTLAQRGQADVGIEWPKVDPLVYF